MRRVCRVSLLLAGIACAFGEAADGAAQERFARLWKEKGIRDYTLRGRSVTFRKTIDFQTVVKGGRVTAYTENGAAAPRSRAITAESLLILASRAVGAGEYVTVRRYDEEYGIPEWISTGRNDITDAGGYIEITDFAPARGGSSPPPPVLRDNRVMVDFDGTRLLYREGEQIFVLALQDGKPAPVAAGVVSGGQAGLAWPNVLWSNLLRRNYFLSVRNMESGGVRTLTDENRTDAASFVCEGRWVAWRDATGLKSTLNLLDLETGSNRAVSDVPFITVAGNALLAGGRLFWLGEDGIYSHQEGRGTRKLSVESGPFPCALLGVEGDNLLFLTQREGKCAAAEGKVVIRCSLSTGRRQEVKARLHSPTDVALGDGFVAWIDHREGIDDVFAQSLEGGAERRVSFGTGHQEKILVRAGTIVWDDVRYRHRTLHFYDYSGVGPR